MDKSLLPDANKDRLAHAAMDERLTSALIKGLRGEIARLEIEKAALGKALVWAQTENRVCYDKLRRIRKMTDL